MVIEGMGDHVPLPPNPESYKLHGGWIGVNSKQDLIHNDSSF